VKLLDRSRKFLAEPIKAIFVRVKSSADKIGIVSPNGRAITRNGAARSTNLSTPWNERPPRKVAHSVRRFSRWSRFKQNVSNSRRNRQLPISVHDVAKLLS
jgi:hypothetical protein